MNYQPDLMMTALKMFLALAVILGAMVAALHMVKRMQGRKAGASAGRMIKVLASSYVGFKKNIALVEVPGAVLVLGITGDNITFLTRLRREDMLEENPDEPGEDPPSSFYGHLKRVTSGFKGQQG